MSALKSCANQFTPDDLDLMVVHYDEKIQYLPPEYRKRLERFARIQIVGGYHRLVTADLLGVHAKEKLPATWKEYVSFAKKESAGGNVKWKCLKYLIAAFSLFIEQIPPHPVGMPFPGGAEVELYEGVYYCPVKDAWAGEDSVLCRFCPAVQSRERDMVLTKEERDRVGKDEKITNYFYNFKG